MAESGSGETVVWLVRNDDHSWGEQFKTKEKAAEFLTIRNLWEWQGAPYIVEDWVVYEYDPTDELKELAARLARSQII